MLPVREGLSPSYVWLPQGEWPTVFSFFCFRFNHISELEWAVRFTAGRVMDVKGVSLTCDTPYQAHRQIFYYRATQEEVVLPLDIPVLYQDDHLLVVDKPHFLTVSPAGRFVHDTLLVRLKKKLCLPELSLIHRLDRDTAGVILLSTCKNTRGIYQALFRERLVEKFYKAIAPLSTNLIFPMWYRSRLGVGSHFFRVKEIEGEPNSETYITLLKTTKNLGLYGLFPRTGQRHQLRVHMAVLGVPIINDHFYPEVINMENERMHPLQLLASQIRFVDPINGHHHCFESRLTLAYESQF